jgi:hypothetical protein
MFRLSLYRGVFRLANRKLAQVREVAYVEGSSAGNSDGKGSLQAAADQCCDSSSSTKGERLPSAVRHRPANPLETMRRRRLAEERFRQMNFAR